MRFPVTLVISSSFPHHHTTPFRPDLRAAKVANKGIVVGESEAASGNLKIKDFSTGEVSNL